MLLLEISREVERMVCAHDVTVAQIDIALALLDKIGVELRLYQSAIPQNYQPLLEESPHELPCL